MVVLFWIEAAKFDSGVILPNVVLSDIGENNRAIFLRGDIHQRGAVFLIGRDEAVKVPELHDISDPFVFGNGSEFGLEFIEVSEIGYSDGVISADLVRLWDNSRLCHHFHLSLQSVHR